MTRVGRPIGRSAALIVVASVVLALGASVVAALGSKTARARTIPANEWAAKADAARLLASFTLPPGSTRFSTQPPGDVAGPTAFLTGPYVAHEVAWWVAPGGPLAVLEYVDADSPRGSSHGGVQEVDARNQIWAQSFTWPRVKRVLSARVVTLTAMQLPNGVTGLRADYFAQWVNVRPAWERIPTGVRLVSGRADYVAASGPPRPVGESRVNVTSPTRIAAIVKLLNATPAAQQQGPSCPISSGAMVGRNRLLEHVRLAFYARPREAPLAVIRLDFTNCWAMALSVRGRHEPALLPPNPKRLLAALGVAAR